MANCNMSNSEVVSICNKLEISPSKNDASGNHGGAPNLEPTAKSSEAVTGGTHLPTKTSEFQMTDRGKTIPGYSGRFAKKATQV